MRFFHPFSVLAVLMAAAVSCSEADHPGIRVTGMRCEYLDTPLVVDMQDPRFLWNYEGDVDFVQHAFKVEVATSEAALARPDVWSSGAVISRTPFAKMPEGRGLVSDKEYFWRVTAWNADSTVVAVSPVASFQTAMMERSDWKAVWITDSHDRDFEAAPVFRKEFDAGKDIVSAKIFMSACAYGEIGLNGNRVSDAFLDPGYTHYDKRNLYTVTDVTGQVRPGLNVLTAVLGNGFYNEIKKVATWQFDNARWRDRARFILEMHILHRNGTRTVVATDSSWKTTSDGPYINNNIYSGDTYDARKEIKGLGEPGFDDSAWECAREVRDPSPVLVAQKMPQIRVTEEIAPIAVTSFGDTVHVFDFGKNISGLCRLSVDGTAGTEVTVSHAELLKDSGRLEPGNIDIYFYPLPGYAFQTDKYIMKGPGPEVWTPSFSYHGFRYAEVKTSAPMKLGPESLTALYFYTAQQSAGTFGCSNELLNTLWEMTRRTYCNNLMSIPTDCPQREKNGWTADAYLSQEIGLLNYDAVLFYEKWLDDFVDNIREDGRVSGIIPTSDWGYDDWIGPVWDAAFFIIPYTLYLYTGDKTPVEKIWPVCKRYLEYLRTREDPDGLVSYGIGDWLPYDTKTPTEFTSALFYFYDYKIMKEFSFILDTENSTLMAKEGALRRAINRKFYNQETGMYASGSQAGQAAALYTGVVPAAEIPKVAAGLEQLVRDRDGHLDFGSMGSKMVLRMLTKYCSADLAFEMASKEDHPSWLAWIHDGYTSLAETWTMSPKFNDASLDHIFFGDISAWMVNDIVGIRKDDLAPGFGHIIIAPHFVKGLDHAEASYNSVRGEIRASWRRSGEAVFVDVTVPVNTAATLTVEGQPDRQLRAGTHRIRIIP